MHERDLDHIRDQLLALVPVPEKEEARLLISKLLPDPEHESDGGWLPSPELPDPIREEMIPPETPALDIDQELKEDMLVIARSIMDVKKQVLTLQLPENSKSKLEEANIELDEIVRTTEEATHRILEAGEAINAVLGRLRKMDCYSSHEEELAEIETQYLNIVMASSFQDITSQRIKKVIAALYFIEYKIGEMMANLGLGIAPTGDNPDIPEKDPDRHLMNGPATPGAESISQDSIDSLFD